MGLQWIIRNTVKWFSLLVIKGNILRISFAELVLSRRRIAKFMASKHRCTRINFISYPCFYYQKNFKVKVLHLITSLLTWWNLFYRMLISQHSFLNYFIDINLVSLLEQHRDNQVYSQIHFRKWVCILKWNYFANFKLLFFLTIIICLGSRFGCIRVLFFCQNLKISKLQIFNQAKLSFYGFFLAVLLWIVKISKFNFW